MPLLPFGETLYSASRRKSRNFSFETRLLALGWLVIAPSSTLQPIGRSLCCTSQGSRLLPSKSATGLPNVCAPLALQAPHVGGRTPTTLIFESMEPVSLPSAARSVTTGFWPVGNTNETLPSAIFTSWTATGLP